ncbi:MAG TPA: cytochrome c oxidase assembly factor Coa1 family protein [Blastocatellia bacterium]|nr:cytochrome c oxidase assembly factor Coa1 family protein [Blastocatellia bacterium]
MLLVGAVILLIAGSVGFFLFGGFSDALNSSDANKVAVKMLRQSPEAASVLGEVTDIGWPYGDLESNFATLYMSVKGKKAAGSFFASLKKENGKWILVSGRLQLSDGTSIDITHGS